MPVTHKAWRCAEQAECSERVRMCVCVCARECAWIMCVCIIRSQTVWSVNRQIKKRLLINCHHQLFVSLSLLSGYARYSISFCVCVCTQCAKESRPKSIQRRLLSDCLIVEYNVRAALYPACRRRTDGGQSGQTHSENEAPV